MLENKVIIYDDSCPMCKLYTYWFVAWGFLKAENRVGFAMAPGDITDHIDLDRARHEIPLYDRETGHTLYGLTALTFILGSRWTWLKPVFASKLFFWAFYPLYQIITFNRRVIAGCKACQGFDCAPDFNLFYRAVYLILTGVFVLGGGGLLLACGSVCRLQAIALLISFLAVGLVNGAVTWVSSGRTIGLEYAGGYATVVTIVCGLLLPLACWPNLPTGLGYVVIMFAGLTGVSELRRRGI